MDGSGKVRGLRCEQHGGNHFWVSERIKGRHPLAVPKETKRKSAIHRVHLSWLFTFSDKQLIGSHSFSCRLFLLDFPIGFYNGVFNL